MPAKDHLPNPFDFVPFSPQGPKLYTRAELDAMGTPYSGYLEFTLKALTPVHVVGRMIRNARSGQSLMYCQDGTPCIPASTIRGCLRSFIEALTSGWVSQADEEYAKNYQERHIGFRAFDSYHNKSQSGLTYDAPPAVHRDFRPSVRPDRKIDVASYLFGIVLEKPKDGEVTHRDLAYRSKVRFEDVLWTESDLVLDKYWIPDLGLADTEGFLGGAKPRASSWWYMMPVGVRGRRTAGHDVAEFIGDSFRGRKFYYHQAPRKCLEEYKAGNRYYDRKHPLYKVWAECVEYQSSSTPFRIYVDHVPRSLLDLLIAAICPGRQMRHKLGYGRAFGYGSVSFTFEQAWLRPMSSREERIAPLVDHTAQIQEWVRPKHVSAWLTNGTARGLHPDEDLVDSNALEWLARILGARNSKELLFAYPEFVDHYFRTPVSQMQFTIATGMHLPRRGILLLNSSDAAHVADKMAETKETIDFRRYQESADGWKEFVWPRKP